MMDNEQLSEQQEEEKKIAQIFLEKYNLRKGTNYEIHQLVDPEDVICLDANTGNRLVIQTTILTDLEGDIPYMKGLKARPMSPTTNSFAVSFNDTLRQLRIRLKEKYKSDFGPNAALVIFQFSPIWESLEWRVVAKIFREEDFFRGKEHLYDAGVWIICTDNSTFPAGYDLYCLNELV